MNPVGARMRMGGGWWRGAALAAAVALAGGVRAGEPAGVPVSERDVDRVIEQIFEQGRAVNRLQADLTTRKSGGRLKPGTSLIQFESVRLSAPNRMWLQNQGENARPQPQEKCSLLIVDGENLWDVQPAEGGRRDVSRRPLRADVKQGGAQNIAAVMLLFLGIDRDVRTARELRDYYDIACTLEPVPNGAPARPGQTYHFVLRPLAGAPDGDVLELWYQEGSTLPWQIRTTQRQEVRWPRPKPGEPKRYTIEETMRVLRNVSTNRDGLREFDANAFRLPLSRDMEVVDEESGRMIPHDEVRRLLDAAARR